MFFRLAKHEDACEIARIMRETQAALPDKSMYIINTEARVAQRIEEQCPGFVGEEDNVVRAFVFYQAYPCRELIKTYESLNKVELLPDAEIIEVDTIAVDISFQGRGIGRLLLKQVERIALERGCSGLIATVDPRNSASLGNFKSQGYSVIDTLSMYADSAPDFIYDVKGKPAEDTSNTDAASGIDVMRHVVYKSLC